MTDQESVEQMLAAIQALTVEVREVRDEGRGRQQGNAAVYTELRDMVTRMGMVVAEHGISIAGAIEKLDSHYRLIHALTESSASNSTLLAKHAELITALGEAISAAKDRAREAMQSNADLKKYTEDFQAAVTRHVSESSQGLQEGMARLETNAAERSAKVDDLAASTHAIVGALELETQVEQAKKGLPPDKKDRTALDALRTKGQGTLIASVAAAVLMVLKLAYEIFSKH